MDLSEIALLRAIGGGGSGGGGGSIPQDVIDGLATKAELGNAGITATSYTTLFGGEFSVTTATDTGWPNYHATASVTGRLSKHYIYRVTVNNTEYILRSRLWFDAYYNLGFKVYEYVGNIGLYINSTSGIPGGTDSSVDFVIISDLDDSNSIDVITETAGEYTIKVERINETLTTVPRSLIYGDEYQPFEIKNNSGTYNGFSIGVNALSNTRGTIAIGYGNTVSHEFGIAIGFGNLANGTDALATGSLTQASGSQSHSEGMRTVASGLNGSHAEGYSTTASGDMSHAEGQLTVSSGKCSHAEGSRTIANHGVQHASGMYNVADSSNEPSYYLGTYVEIVGNGTADNERSNARALDWSGNEYLNGDVYVHCSADSTGGVKLAQETQVVTVTGSTPTITGVANTRYMCGEVSTLSITPPQTGIIDVIFESGSTATVLTLPNTVAMPDWFVVEAERIYEISIMDGTYGAVMSWEA